MVPVYKWRWELRMYKRFLGLIFGGLASLGLAHAATVSLDVANADFEEAVVFSSSTAYHGQWGNSAPGWSIEGEKAGVWSPVFENFFTSYPDLGEQVGWVTSGSTIYQELDYVIQEGASYSFSALFGDRVDKDFGGVFGFFVGDISNVIASAEISSSGDGQWGLDEIMLLAVSIDQYAGQKLGIFVSATLGQVDLDQINVDEVIVNPLPGAVWLFGAGLLGGVMRIKKKKRG